MDNWQTPRGYNLENMYHKITCGDGWVVLKGIFSDTDFEMAIERIFIHKFGEANGFVNPDDKHNNYSGLTWGLLSRGKIFAKIATHPVIMEVSRRLLGSRCPLSSLAANTVAWKDRALILTNLTITIYGQIKTAAWISHHIIY